jgi:hypothetical protein
MNKILTLLLLGILLYGCDKDFESINKNPATTTSIDPKLLFSTSLMQAAGNPWQNEGAVLSYASCFVQHLAALTPNWQGDKYFFDAFHNDVQFIDGYKNEVKTLVDLIHQIKDDPKQRNLLAMARILKVFVFHRITDLYGDIPYFEAGRAYIDGIFQPAYDSQQDIYLDMLKELEEATDLLDENQTSIGSADFIYQGEVEKWRKFGNTLMLRLALRLVNAGPAQAEIWTKKAISRGIMQSLDDSALLPHSDGDILVQNGIGYVFAIEDNSRLSKTFVDWLAAKNDPRLPVLSYVASGTAPKGLPHGLDGNMLQEQTGDTDLETYSRVNPIFVKRSTPTLFQAYAEAEFMLAEAAVRGWHTGDAATHYQNGIRAAMKQLTLLAPETSISEQEIENYLVENPLIGEDSKALRLINTQYWAATFLNGLEAFANWRRTGFPELSPSNYTGNTTGGTIPRRLRYPQKEYSVNDFNLNAAIKRQGEDLFTTRVWWDK